MNPALRDVAGGFAQLAFCPPGANELPDAADLSDAAFAARDIPAMFTGTYRGAPTKELRVEVTVRETSGDAAVVQHS